MIPNDRLPQEKRAEFSDDNPDLVGDQVKDHRHGTSYGGESSFIQAYSEVKAHFLIRFRSREGQEFLACVQRDWRGLGLLEKADSVRSEAEDDAFWPSLLQRRFLILSEALRRTYHRHGQQQTVFVDNAQAVEGPKERISSLIWVEAVENFSYLHPHSWYVSAAEGFVDLGGFRDWELCVASDDLNQTAGEVIERTTETMQYITDYQWKVAGDGWDLADIVRDLSSLRIRVEGDIYRVSIPEFKVRDFELLDVLVGPIVLV